MLLVVDASAAVRLVMRAEAADRLLASVAAAEVVVAPTVFVAEVANALSKYVLAGSLKAEIGLERYQEAVSLIDVFTPDRELATEALSEAIRYRHPVYDLLYAVLARRTGGSVLTLDKRLAALVGRMEIAAI